MTGLGLTPSGSLDVPPAEEENLAGWYEAGTTRARRAPRSSPGTSTTPRAPPSSTASAPWKKGATIEVDRRDGGVAVFTVDAVEVYAAKDFPDQKVYGAANRPELRVITCGGDYSRSTGYQGNVVVFAHLTGSR